MKTKQLIPLIAGCGLCLVQIAAQAQQKYTTHISKQFTLQQPASASVLAVHNLMGSVHVEGYSGNAVVIEVDETISADSNEEIEKGKQEVKLGFDQKRDTIMAYTAEPYDTRPNQHRDYDSDRHIHYHLKLDYTIKVPFAINLRITAVNEGNIDIKDVAGTLKINNINGAIAITNAKGTTEARTINGNLTVSYLTVPPEASSYYTLNGKLSVTYPSALSADLQFKSMNGQFYTDFDNAEVLPAQIIKTEGRKGDKGTVYKLSKNTQVRIGSGGKLFKFETLNGNIYIKKS